MALIMVVDDSETLRSQLCGDLESDGHSVVEAVDGLNGLEVLSQTSGVQLILCDVNMPKMDGLTMCEKISEDAALKAIPKIMLTTESNAELKARGKAAGVIAWVTKPYNPSSLLAAVKKILSR